MLELMQIVSAAMVFFCAYEIEHTRKEVKALQAKLDRMHDHLLKLMDAKGVSPF